MKVSELDPSTFQEGMRVTGLKSGQGGTVIYIDRNDDDYHWILWDNDTLSYAGWYGNDCECEVREEVAELASYQDARNHLLDLIKSAGYKYPT